MQLAPCPSLQSYALVRFFSDLDGCSLLSCGFSACRFPILSSRILPWPSRLFIISYVVSFSLSWVGSHFVGALVKFASSALVWLALLAHGLLRSAALAPSLSNFLAALPPSSVQLFGHSFFGFSVVSLFGVRFFVTCGVLCLACACVSFGALAPLALLSPLWSFLVIRARRRRLRWWLAFRQPVLARLCSVVRLRCLCARVDLGQLLDIAYRMVWPGLSGFACLLCFLPHAPCPRSLSLVFGWVLVVPLCRGVGFSFCLSGGHVFFSFAGYFAFVLVGYCSQWLLSLSFCAALLGVFRIHGAFASQIWLPLPLP